MPAYPHAGENAFVELSINDNLSINAADYLYIQEYGSALNGIIATHPIEKTMHECKSIIDNAYSSCIDKILQNSLTNIEEKAILKKAAMTISNMLKQNADSKISKYVSCFVKYKGIKI